MIFTLLFYHQIIIQQTLHLIVILLLMMVCIIIKGISRRLVQYQLLWRLIFLFIILFIKKLISFIQAKWLRLPLRIYWCINVLVFFIVMKKTFLKMRFLILLIASVSSLRWCFNFRFYWASPIKRLRDWLGML